MPGSRPSRSLSSSGDNWRADAAALPYRDAARIRGRCRPVLGSTGTGLPERADHDEYADRKAGGGEPRALVDELHSRLARCIVKRLPNDGEDAILRPAS